MILANTTYQKQINELECAKYFLSQGFPHMLKRNIKTYERYERMLNRPKIVFKMRIILERRS